MSARDDFQIQQLTFSSIVSPRPIGKRITKNADGTLHKGAPRMPFEGVVRRHRCGSLREFDALVVALPPNAVLVHGVAAVDRANLTTADKLPSAGRDYVARSADCFDWAMDDSGLMPLDIDPPPGSGVLDEGAVDKKLCQTVPVLGHVTRLYRPSASSNIVDAETGEMVAGLTGLHVYIAVSSAKDIPAIVNTIAARQVLAGEAYVKFSRSGTPLVRTPVDPKVAKPEHADFISAEVGAGLVQQRAPGRVFEAEGRGSDLWGDIVLDPADVVHLTQVELDEVKRIEQAMLSDPAIVDEAERRKAEWARSKAREMLPDGDETALTAAADMVIRREAAGQLFGSFVIRFSNGETATVDEIVANPAKYHGMRCHDPIDDEGDPRIAHVMGARTNGRSGVAIHSHMHGVRMFDLVSSKGLFDDVSDGGATPRDTAAAPTSVEAFQSYLPTGKCIHMATNGMWVRESVNRTVKWPKGTVAVKRKDKTTGETTTTFVEGDIPPAEWLDKNRPIHQMGWLPGQAQIVEGKAMLESGIVASEGNRLYNLYKQPPQLPGDPTKAGPWLKLVSDVYPDHAEHIIKWLAHYAQRPHVKVNHALVLGGSPGIGKDTILEPIKHGCVGAWNFADIKPKDIFGNFNSWARNVLVRVSEVHNLGTETRYQLYEATKTVSAQLTTPLATALSAA